MAIVVNPQHIEEIIKEAGNRDKKLTNKQTVALKLALTTYITGLFIMNKITVIVKGDKECHL